MCREVGNRFERALSVRSVALWSSVAGCGLICTGWRHTELGMEMILIKEIVGCLNLIRLSVPLTDVIVLIGSFVSFTHSVDVTMGMFFFCLFATFPHCLLGQFYQYVCFSLHYVCVFASVYLPLY